MGNRSVGDEEQPRGKSNLTVCHKVYASRRHPKKRIKMPAKTMRRENGVRHKPTLIRRAPTAAWIPPDPSPPAERGTGTGFISRVCLRKQIPSPGRIPSTMLCRRCAAEWRLTALCKIRPTARRAGKRRKKRAVSGRCAAGR